MPRGKVNEPATSGTDEEPKYTLTLIPSTVENPYLAPGGHIGSVEYRAILRYGDDVIDDWRTNSRNEAEVDAQWKKYAHQVKIGKVGEVVIPLDDDTV